MPFRTAPLASVMLFLLCAAAAAGLRASATALRPASLDDLAESLALPLQVVGPLSFGMRSVLADLNFLDAVQTNGGRRPELKEAQQERDDRVIARRLRTAVELDPRFEVAYRFAGNALPRHTVDNKAYGVLAALPILEKGVRDCPDDWHIPFLLGFYQSFYLGRMADAARSMSEAARRRGAPGYVGLLATRLAADANELQTAERMAITMMEQADNDEARTQWEGRIVDLHMERDLRAIEAAALRHRDSTGDYPASIEALVRAGELPAVPREPHGGKYLFDQATGVARSDKSERLRVHGSSSGLEVH